QGLVDAAAAHGIDVDDQRFQAVIDHQARSESGPYRSYAEIAADSLVHVLRMPKKAARTIAEEAGAWPLFPDAADGLRALMRIAPCVAMTNSDQSHGKQVQDQLGFRLNGWICAEDVRCYKPAPEFWTAVSSRRGVPFGRSWWHVSAYADYDMATAGRLGLTTVFIERDHNVWGPSSLTAPDLRALAVMLAG
ncbi:MAG TPA: HAD family hydrolase, partial [Candidatus Eisenbacteria bacterium]|nr:HAD family hydrolase [Candidatus Eisenbacteria bacterium]